MIIKCYLTPEDMLKPIKEMVMRYELQNEESRKRGEELGEKILQKVNESSMILLNPESDNSSSNQDYTQNRV